MRHYEVQHFLSTGHFSCLKGCLEFLYKILNQLTTFWLPPAVIFFIFLFRGNTITCFCLVLRLVTDCEYDTRGGFTDSFRAFNSFIAFSYILANSFTLAVNSSVLMVIRFLFCYCNHPFYRFVFSFFTLLAAPYVTKAVSGPVIWKTKQTCRGEGGGGRVANFDPPEVTCKRRFLDFEITFKPLLTNRKVRGGKGKNVTVLLPLPSDRILCKQIDSRGLRCGERCKMGQRGPLEIRLHVGIQGHEIKRMTYFPAKCFLDSLPTLKR